MSGFETEMTTQKCVVIFISLPAFSGTHVDWCLDGVVGAPETSYLGVTTWGNFK
jgi:hypothetical protein